MRLGFELRFGNWFALRFGALLRFFRRGSFSPWIDLSFGFVLPERGGWRGQKIGPHLVPPVAAPDRVGRARDARRPEQGEPHGGTGLGDVQADGKEKEHRVEGQAEGCGKRPPTDI
ncbi:hypothetical protein [Fretibacterium fastidiosum]|uniref:hypothetical protein n=1 Tax=Fretibacterium fastidiosum TaxID=651822 RepID=UPI0038FD3DEB